MEILLVGMPGNPTYRSVEDLLIAGSAFGLTYTGVETAEHLIVPLQGLPKFKELAGPMGGQMEAGQVRVRYETWDANEMYSR